MSHACSCWSAKTPRATRRRLHAGLRTPVASIASSPRAASLRLGRGSRESAETGRRAGRHISGYQPRRQNIGDRRVARVSSFRSLSRGALGVPPFDACANGTSDRHAEEADDKQPFERAASFVWIVPNTISIHSLQSTVTRSRAVLTEASPSSTQKRVPTRRLRVTASPPAAGKGQSPGV